MGFNPNWHPSELPEFDKRWSHAVLPVGGDVPPDQVERLMVIFQQQSAELIDLVANSIYYEETTRYARDEHKNRAFRESAETSDRRREADSLEDPRVKLAERAYIKARAIRKEIEMKYDSAIRAHHAMKALAKNKTEEQWLGR